MNLIEFEVEYEGLYFECVALEEIIDDNCYLVFAIKRITDGFHSEVKKDCWKWLENHPEICENEFDEFVQHKYQLGEIYNPTLEDY